MQFEVMQFELFVGYSKLHQTGMLVVVVVLTLWSEEDWELEFWHQGY